MSPLIIDTFESARQAYLSKDLKQALYDAGEVVMADVMVNLLYRRKVFFRYENDLFPGIIQETLSPQVAAGNAELVSFSHQLMMNLAARPRPVSIGELIRECPLGLQECSVF